MNKVVRTGLAAIQNMAIRLFSVSALLLVTGALHAYEIDLDLNLAGKYWLPDDYYREDARIHDFLISGNVGHATGLENKTCQEFLASVRIRTDSRTNIFYGNYSQSQMKTHYMITSLLTFPFDPYFSPLYQRTEGNVGWIHFLPGKNFGFGAGLRRIDTAADLTMNDPFSLNYAEKRQVFSATGPELNFQLDLDVHNRFEINFSVFLFSLAGPYRLDLIDTYYSSSLLDPDLFYRTTDIVTSNPGSRTVRRGGEFNLNLKAPLTEHLSANIGYTYQYSTVRIKNYSSQYYYISEDPLMNDPMTQLWMYSLNNIGDALFMKPFYNKDFADRFFRIYIGLGLRL